MSDAKPERKVIALPGAAAGPVANIRWRGPFPKGTGRLSHQRRLRRASQELDREARESLERFEEQRVRDARSTSEALLREAIAALGQIPRSRLEVAVQILRSIAADYRTARE